MRKELSETGIASESPSVTETATRTENGVAIEKREESVTVTKIVNENREDAMRAKTATLGVVHESTLGGPWLTWLPLLHHS